MAKHNGISSLESLREFVQRRPIVFWATVGFAVVIGILFVLVPSEQVEEPTKPQSGMPTARGPEGRAEVSRRTDPVPPERPLDADESLRGVDRTVPGPSASRRRISAAGRVVPEKAPGPGFTVQVGSFVSENAANSLAAKLESSGYPAFVTGAQVPGKGATYRVRVGRFASREEARRYGERLVAQEDSVKTVFATVND